MGTGVQRSRELANLLQNRFLRGGLGIFFERWLFDQLGAGLKLDIIGADSSIQHKFAFTQMSIIASCSVEMDQNIVYKLDRTTLPTIEGYSLVDSRLLLLQSTVSETHSAARYDDVKEIVQAARRAVIGRLTILVVYIAPSHKEFHLPVCAGFPRGTAVVRGMVDDSKFAHLASSRKRGGGATEGSVDETADEADEGGGREGGGGRRTRARPGTAQGGRKAGP
jgi:hypothetical protein